MRNYFPLLFGNETAKQLLGADISEKKQHHAYMIEGPVGSGKHLLAKEFSKALLCADPHSPTLPCGNCIHCRKIDAGRHTDIQYISCAKGTISVETVRSTLGTLPYAPDEGDYQIYIIEDAHRMTPQAQNALLLSLEEPPAYAVFLLLTEDAAALLETIHSRACSIKMEQFSPDVLFSYLKEKNRSVSDEKLQEAVLRSGGTIGAAQKILSGDSATATLSAAAEAFVTVLCTGTGTDALAHCAELRQTLPREEYDLFFVYAMSAVRDRIAAKLSGRDMLFYKSAPAPGGHTLTVKRLTALYDALYAAREDIVQPGASNTTITTVLYTLVEQHFRKE